VGILNQVSIVIGVLVAQVLGFFFARPGSWRLVFVIAFGLSVLQFLLGLRNVESPAWLASNNRKPEARSVSAKLWKTAEATSGGGGAYEEDDLEEALLRETEPLPNPQVHPPATIGQCFRIAELRRPLIIVSLSMFFQQVSGQSCISSVHQSLPYVPQVSTLLCITALGSCRRHCQKLLPTSP
jgi:SP family facilitated glucose transporter-like MFS transporter 3